MEEKRCISDGCGTLITRTYDDGKSSGPRYRSRCDVCLHNKKYGITKPERDILPESQGGKCAICEKEIEFTGKITDAVVDHCHESKEVRGILCSKCNLGLGHFEDDRVRLIKALEYLTKE